MTRGEQAGLRVVPNPTEGEIDGEPAFNQVNDRLSDILKVAPGDYAGITKDLHAQLAEAGELSRPLSVAEDDLFRYYLGQLYPTFETARSLVGNHGSLHEGRLYKAVTAANALLWERIHFYFGAEAEISTITGPDTLQADIRANLLSRLAPATSTAGGAFNEAPGFANGKKLDTSWQASAECREKTNSDSFFPERGANTRDAKATCRECQVRSECLDYAIASGQKFGVWGGLTERERRRVRRRRAIDARKTSLPTN